MLWMFDDLPLAHLDPNQHDEVECPVVHALAATSPLDSRTAGTATMDVNLCKNERKLSSARVVAMGLNELKLPHSVEVGHVMWIQS